MPTLTSLAAVAIPFAALAYQLYPKLEFAGAFRTAVELNNKGQCTKIPELEACEDAWIHQDSGLAYLPCSDIQSRAAWLPAMLHLNASALASPVSSDYVALLDLKTGTHSRLAVTGLPAEARGLWLHAIEVYEDPQDPAALTVFLNSHRPPLDASKSKTDGACSVIEIFETRLGESELRYVKTLQDVHVRTPNSMAAIGPREIYISNDHRRKSHWSRIIEAIYAEPSDIVFCDASGDKPDCKVAVDNLIYPNGLARSGDTIYSASTLAGNVRAFEQQADHTLVLLDEITVPRPIDNIVVDSATGAIYAATFPKILHFIDASTPQGREDGLTSAVEVWKISNETSEDKYYGGKYKVEMVFADKGDTVSGSTCAASYKNKLLMTGVLATGVVICDV